MDGCDRRTQRERSSHLKSVREVGSSLNRAPFSRKSKQLTANQELQAGPTTRASSFEQENRLITAGRNGPAGFRCGSQPAAKTAALNRRLTRTLSVRNRPTSAGQAILRESSGKTGKTGKSCDRDRQRNCDRNHKACEKGRGFIVAALPRVRQPRRFLAGGYLK